MFNIAELYEVIDCYAPFKISQAFIDGGSYDNSGILIKSKDSVNRILFSLDLSDESVRQAKKLKCDTIVTHHPAIYNPLREISVDSLTSGAVAKALSLGMNVISMHLNLDGAKTGIDYYLAKGLGAITQKIFTELMPDCGYGREFEIQPIKFCQYVKTIKKEFETNKIITYGSQNREIKRVASFCGGGASDVMKLTVEGKINADLIVTSDMAHHAITQCVEAGYNVMLLTHHASEIYGFKRAYESIKQRVEGMAECYYFDDKRFK